MVYKFECDLWDADYVGYTARHLHQRIYEHKYSAIGRHLEQPGLSKADLVDKQFSVLKKCRSKFDCLIFEMLFIKELNPELNTVLKKTLFAPNSLRDSACEYFIIITYFRFYSLSLRNSFTFIFVLVSLIVDLIMTLSERRNVVAFLNF